MGEDFNRIEYSVHERMTMRLLTTVE